MTTKRNVFGRDFKHGVGLSSDFRSLIIQKLIEKRGNTVTGEVPWGVFSCVAKTFKVCGKTVSKLWQRFVQEGSINDKMRHRRGRPKLTEPDIRFIEFLKRDKPSISGKEIQAKLKNYSPVSGDVCASAINRAVIRELNFTYKRLKRQCSVRYTQENLLYTQAYINFCQTKRTRQIKFMDESGFKLSNLHRVYGHSERGKPCIEVGKYVADRNLTLNLLIGVDCVLYYNFVDGTSNTYTYLNFWHEASQTQDEYGRPVLLPGDFIVVDNCPIHKNNAERILRLYFGQQNVQYGFLPSYSPDFNPVENCFLKLKKILSQEHFLPCLQVNLKLAITRALKEISESDIRGFYRNTGYLNVT
jgi:transposase